MQLLKDIKPLNGNILVIDNKLQEKTKGGIYLPEQRTEELKSGKVLAVSSKTTLNGIIIEPETKKGDQVLYKNVAGAGNCWESDGDMYRMLNPVEILAVVE